MIITEESSELSALFEAWVALAAAAAAAETPADVEVDEESSSSSIKFITVLTTGFSGSFGGGTCFFRAFRSGFERAFI